MSDFLFLFFTFIPCLYFVRIYSFLYLIIKSIFLWWFIDKITFITKAICFKLRRSWRWGHVIHSFFLSFVTGFWVIWLLYNIHGILGRVHFALRKHMHIYSILFLSPETSSQFETSLWSDVTASCWCVASLWWKLPQLWLTRHQCSGPGVTTLLKQATWNQAKQHSIETWHLCLKRSVPDRCLRVYK